MADASQEQDLRMRIPRHMTCLGIAALALVQVFPAIAEVGATGDAVEGFELAAAPTLLDADPTSVSYTHLTLPTIYSV